MSFTRIFSLIVGLTFFTFQIFAQDQPRSITPMPTWQVQNYDLTVTVPNGQTDRSIDTKASLTVKNISTSPASTVTLRISTNAVVSAVTANGANADFSSRSQKVTASSELQNVAVRIPSVAPGSSVNLQVSYKLNIKENSGLSSLSPVGASFLPLSFWYPTPNSWFFARGADYAPVKIKVAAPASHKVISDGRNVNGQYEASLNSQPFFVTGQWEETKIGDTKALLKAGSGPEAKDRAAELSAIINEAKAYLSPLLGAGPDVEIKIVAARRGAGYSSNGTILVDEDVFRRNKLDSQTVMNVVESMAKLWIGGKTAIFNEGQGVIREGLPKYLATEFLATKYGNEVADVERLRQRLAYYSVARRDSPLSLVSPLDDYYYAAVANKGAMVWRLIGEKAGKQNLIKAVTESLADGKVDLPEIRTKISDQKELLDYLFDQVTDTNLLVGLPQIAAGSAKVAIRNTGSIDVTVNVVAFPENGSPVKTPVSVKAKSFGEVVFKSPGKISRIVIDPEKFYPQTEYADDTAPKELSDDDPLLAVKRLFDKQDYPGTEALARIVLRDTSELDDVRILLGRALLSQNKITEAEREFRQVLNSKLPSSRSISWANVGIAEVAAKSGRNDEAQKFAQDAIRADGEYGATLAARNLRNRLNYRSSIDPSINAFFANFDKVAASNRKADMDAIVLSGEASRFASGISGQTVEWKTNIAQVEKLDDNNVVVEVGLNIRLINKENETGTAVYRLTKVGSEWKLSNVDILEVR